MAEALLHGVARSAVSKLTSFLEGPVVFRRKGKNKAPVEYYRLGESLHNFCILLQDPRIEQLREVDIRLWLEVNSVIYDCDDLLDEIATKALWKMRFNKDDQVIYSTLLNELFTRQIEDLRYSLDILGDSLAVELKKVEYGSSGDSHYSYGSEGSAWREWIRKRKKVGIVLGRKEDEQEILKQLSDASSSDAAANHATVFAVVGVAGIGKTTLAQSVFYDNWVCTNFDLKLWVSPVDGLDITKLMECILHAVYEDGSWGSRLESLESRFSDAIRGKKCFLVLDGVQDEDEDVLIELLHMLQKDKRGSVVLFTTRGRKVASSCATVAPYELLGLSEDASRSLFWWMKTDHIPEKIRHAILQMCKGNPSRIKFVGDALQHHSFESHYSRSMVEIMNYAYRKLPSHLRACIAYSYVLLANTQTCSSYIINCWRAQGLLPYRDSGYGYICRLLMKSFLQEYTFLFINRVGHVKVPDLLYNSVTANFKNEIAFLPNDVSQISNATKHIVWRGAHEFLSTDEFSEALRHAKRLRTLKFGGKIRHISTCLLETVISSFKRLRVLDASNCTLELPESIGELIHLRLLNLSRNHAIKVLPHTICNLFNLQTLYLDGCEQLEDLPRDIEKLVNLSHFSITTKQSTLVDTKLNELSALEHLEFFSCLYLTSLWADHKNLTSLRKLLIFNCPLVSFPSCDNHLSCLEELVIHDCPELDFTEGKGLCGLKSLRSLEISGIQKLVEFPTELYSATALEHLLLSNCRSLRRLWRPMPILSSLQTLCIYDCPNLLILPKELCSHRALRLLDIRQCFCLSRIFSRNRGHGWKLIWYISEIIINGRLLSVQDVANRKRRSTKASSSIIGERYIPRRLSYFSSKLITMRCIYSEGRGMEEDKPLKLILPSNWEVLSLAFRAIVRMKIMAKEKHISLGKQSVCQKSSRWKLLSLVLRAIIRMKNIGREENMSPIPILSDGELGMMLYCCLFDANYEFEREKLIQLWIAAKFLRNEPLEVVGERFFDFLVEKNCIFRSRVDILSQARLYKVNLEELNATFSQIPSVTYYQMQLEDANMTANSIADSWHISISSGKIEQRTFEILKKYGDLRTLLFLNGSLIEQVPSDIFLGLQLLQTLDLSGSCITELPSSIGDAKELCYVDLSKTPIKRLPQSIFCLKKLQTLRLKSCIHLFGLPKGIKELVNLRHLDFDVLGQLSSMPRGIDALVQLRTLPAFIVDDKKSCNIIELKNLNNLSGKFCISGLECVLNSEDAKEVELANKKHLKKLELRWSDVVQFQKNEKQCFSGVVECLKPSFSLEELKLICYPGDLLPNWIGDPQYTNLLSITLFKCENCLTLPSLGKLIKLKSLYICEMNSVGIIDYKFCKVDMDHDAFPMLEVLTIDGMLSLEAWTVPTSGVFPRLRELSMKRCPHLRTVTSFPSLHTLKHLEVTHCHSLEVLPDVMLSPLETLIIDSTPKLEKRYSIGGIDSNKIYHIPHVFIDSEDALSNDGDYTEDDDDIQETLE